jgi:hypothetical protein
MAEKIRTRQLLHLELEQVDDVVCTDVGNLDIAGIHPSCAAADAAWKAEAQDAVDDAQTRYCMAQTHRLLGPSARAAVSTR